MKNILITGFEPFGGEKINPSYEALKLLPETIDNAKIHILRLPVIFGKNGALLQQSIDELDPDIIICVGQAGGRSGLTFEKIAINCQNASVPDNDGNQPHDEPVIEQGPAAYFATLPLSQMIAACKKSRLQSRIFIPCRNLRLQRYDVPPAPSFSLRCFKSAWRFYSCSVRSGTGS